MEEKILATKPTVEKTEGEAGRPPAKGQTKCRAWLFTANKHPTALICRLNATYPHYEGTEYGLTIFCQLERAPTTGKKHLQGIIIYAQPQDFYKVRKDLPGCFLRKVTHHMSYVIGYVQKIRTRDKESSPLLIGDRRPDLMARAKEEAARAMLLGYIPLDKK